MKFFSRKLTVEAAFEKEYNLSAKDYPSVCNFLAAKLIGKYNINNSGESGHMNVASLRTKLSFLDKAIKEVLSKLKNTDGTKLIDFVDKKTDFNQMINSLVRKYLNFYDSEDDVYDIVVSAFTDVFLERGKKAFQDFDGTVVDGDKSWNVSIEPYIHMLLKRAIIHHSKMFSERFNTRKDITPYEDESDEDAFEREVNNHVQRLKPHDRQIFKELVDAIKKKFRRDSNPERVEKIFELLLLGYKKSDIAKELNVSNTRVGDYVWLIKETVEEVARDLKKQGDSDLLDQLERNFKKK